MGSPLSTLQCVIQGQSNAEFAIQSTGGWAAAGGIISTLTGIPQVSMRGDIAVNQPNGQTGLTVASGTGTWIDQNSNPINSLWMDGTGGGDPSTWPFGTIGNQFANWLNYQTKPQASSTQPTLFLSFHTENDSHYMTTAQDAQFQAVKERFWLLARNAAGYSGNFALAPVFLGIVPYGYGTPAAGSSIQTAYTNSINTSANNMHWAYGYMSDAWDRGDISHTDDTGLQQAMARFAIVASKWLWEQGYSHNTLDWLPSLGPRIQSVAIVNDGTNTKTIYTVQHDKGNALAIPSTINSVLQDPNSTSTSFQYGIDLYDANNTNLNTGNITGNDAAHFTVTWSGSHFGAPKAFVGTSSSQLLTDLGTGSWSGRGNAIYDNWPSNVTVPSYATSVSWPKIPLRITDHSSGTPGNRVAGFAGPNQPLDADDVLYGYGTSSGTTSSGGSTTSSSGSTTTTPSTTSSTGTTTASLAQAPLNWWAGRRFGVNLERQSLDPSGPKSFVNIPWTQWKNAGVDFVRYFPLGTAGGSANGGATFANNATSSYWDQALNKLQGAINAGIGVQIDCMDISDVTNDFQNLNSTCVAQLQMIANKVLAKGWSPTQVKISICNEVAGNTNAAYAGYRDQFFKVIRAILPNHVITVASAQWGALQTLTDGTWTLPPDAGFDVMIHGYPPVGNTTIASFWQGVANTLDSFSSSHNNCVVFWGEAGTGDASGNNVNDLSHYPLSIQSMIIGSRVHIPCVWAVTYGAFAINSAQQDGTLRFEIEAAIRQSLGLPAPAALSPAVTVNRNQPVPNGNATVTGSASSGNSTPIYLEWVTTGNPQLQSINPSEWATASTSPGGSFSATVGFDHPGSYSSLWYQAGSNPPQWAWTGVNGSSTAQTPFPSPPATASSGFPTTSSSGTTSGTGSTTSSSGSTTSTTGSTTTATFINVNQPSPLIAATDVITGTDNTGGVGGSDTVDLNWINRVPPSNDPGWTRATFSSGTTSFSANIVVDHPGTQGTMYYRRNSGAAVAAWSATPVTSSSASSTSSTGSTTSSSGSSTSSTGSSTSSSGSSTSSTGSSTSSSGSSTSSTGSTTSSTGSTTSSSGTTTTGTGGVIVNPAQASTVIGLQVSQNGGGPIYLAVRSDGTAVLDVQKGSLTVAGGTTSSGTTSSNSTSGSIAIPSGYVQVFSDSFTGTSLNTTLWPTSANGTAAGHVFSPSNVLVNNGLTIQAVSTSGAWSSAAISTYSTTSGQGWNGTYGLFIFNGVKCNAAQGIGPDIALLSQAQTLAPELDLFTDPSTAKNTLQFVVWYADLSQTSGENKNVFQFAVDDTTPHQIALLWTPGQLQYYRDGNLLTTVTTNVPSVPMYPAIAGFVAQSTDTNYGGAPGSTTTSPWNMNVSNVQIWQLPGTGSTSSSGSTTTNPTTSSSGSTTTNPTTSSSGSTTTATPPLTQFSAFNNSGTLHLTGSKTSGGPANILWSLDNTPEGTLSSNAPDGWFDYSVATVPSNGSHSAVASIAGNTASSVTSQFVWPDTSVPSDETVTVTQPNPLIAGTQPIYGFATNPTQAVWLNWINRVPPSNDPGWTQVTMSSNGSFSAASVVIDHPGTQGSMYYRVNSNPGTIAWSASPLTTSTTPTTTSSSGSTTTNPTTTSSGSTTTNPSTSSSGSTTTGGSTSSSGSTTSGSVLVEPLPANLPALTGGFTNSNGTNSFGARSYASVGPVAGNRNLLFNPRKDVLHGNDQFDNFYTARNWQQTIAAMGVGGFGGWRSQSVWLKAYRADTNYNNNYDIAWRGVASITLRSGTSNTYDVITNQSRYLIPAGDPIVFWMVAANKSKGDDGSVSSTFTHFALNSQTTLQFKQKITVVDSVVQSNGQQKYGITISGGGAVTNQVVDASTANITASDSNDTQPTNQIYFRHWTFYKNPTTGPNGGNDPRFQVQHQLNNAQTNVVPFGGTFVYCSNQGEPVYRDWSTEIADFGWPLVKELMAGEMQYVASILTTMDPRLVCYELENEPTNDSVYVAHLPNMYSMARQYLGPDYTIIVKGSSFGSLDWAIHNTSVKGTTLYSNGTTNFFVNPDGGNMGFVTHNYYNQAHYWDTSLGATNGALISFMNDIDGQYYMTGVQQVMQAIGAQTGGMTEFGIDVGFVSDNRSRGRAYGRLLTAAYQLGLFIYAWSYDGDGNTCADFYANTTSNTTVHPPTNASLQMLYWQMRPEAEIQGKALSFSAPLPNV